MYIWNHSAWFHKSRRFRLRSKNCSNVHAVVPTSCFHQSLFVIRWRRSLHPSSLRIRVVNFKRISSFCTMSSNSGIQIPSRLPLLCTHDGVLLPGSTMRISVDTARNMQLVKSRLLKGTSLKSTIIGIIPNTRDPEHDSDELPSLHRCVCQTLSDSVLCNCHWLQLWNYVP